MSDYDNELSKIVAELNRSAGYQHQKGSPSKSAISVPVPADATLDRLLELAARRGASDLLLIAGSGVLLRVNGSLVRTPGDLLDDENIRSLVLPLLAPGQLRELEKNKSVDLSAVREGIGRFRLNLHYQRGSLAASIRLLPLRIPTLESLNLPPVLSKLADRRQGLVLVTGPTGCGKSSTLAAMIDLINTRRCVHVVTIEDPIEYEHSNRMAVIEQIEVGHDTPDFASSLRSILRQTPDVILVGEMRDAETMAAALTAAETGHLVLSTLHTNDAMQTVSRILDSFPSGHQQQIRQQLSLALAAVITQQLVPGLAENVRYPAVEIMIATDAVRNLIRRGEDHQLRSQISVGRADGMQTMEQSLAELFRQGKITSDAAHAHSFRADDLRHYLDR